MKTFQTGFKILWYLVFGVALNYDKIINHLQSEMQCATFCLHLCKHENVISMDWFKGKFTGTPLMINRKIDGFRLRFSQEKPIHWLNIFGAFRLVMGVPLNVIIHILMLFSMKIIRIFMDFPICNNSAWAMRFPMLFHQTSKCSWGRLRSWSRNLLTQKIIGTYGTYIYI